MMPIHRNRKRPWPVTLMIWGVFLLGGWNVGRAIAISQESLDVMNHGELLDPRIRFGLAAFWSLLFIGLAAGLRQKKPVTKLALPILLVGYAVNELALSFLFAQSAPARQSWAVNGLFYLSLILFTSWAFSRASVKNYFKP